MWRVGGRFERGDGGRAGAVVGAVGAGEEPRSERKAGGRRDVGGPVESLFE